MTLNVYFKRVSICETFELCDVVECLGHFDSVVPSRACIHGIHSGKYILKTPGNAISETMSFKISLGASAHKLPTIHYQPGT